LSPTVFTTEIPGKESQVATVKNIHGRIFVLDDSQLSQPHLVQKGDALSRNAVIETGTSGRASLEMMRGPEVRLDTHTRLHLQSYRSLYLERGAAYVDSQQEAVRISVVTKLGTITDKGTQFEVRVSDEFVRVRVREGAVFLKQQRTRTQIAQANEQLSVDHGGNTSVKRIERYGPEWAWISEVAPALQIENRSVLEVLRRVSRENGWTLNFAEDDIRKRATRTILHGSSDEVPQTNLLDVVLPVSGLKYSIQQGVLTVHSEKGKFK
jgi:ferric-dicitrate binding protein FerR (iron transport regulator)